MTSAIKQFPFTEAQVSKLMAMQDELNTYIHPEWKTQGFDWDLAANDEYQEILSHLGWKWWKKDYKIGITDGNKAQIKLELIDNLHFIISSMIEYNYSADVIAEYFNTGFMQLDSHTLDFEHLIKSAQADVLYHCIGGKSLVDLAKAMHVLDMTEVEILETYTQKYVLNKFRQDHGYKDGSYVKVWQIDHNTKGLQTLEDNEVLANIVEWLKDHNEDTTDETALYNQLRTAYNSRLNQ